MDQSQKLNMHPYFPSTRNFLFPYLHLNVFRTLVRFTYFFTCFCCYYCFVFLLGLHSLSLFYSVCLNVCLSVSLHFSFFSYFCVLVVVVVVVCGRRVLHLCTLPLLRLVVSISFLLSSLPRVSMRMGILIFVSALLFLFSFVDD